MSGDVEAFDGAPTARLSRWIATEVAVIPDHVAHQARRVLLDSLGAALVGAATPSAQVIARYVAATDTADQATVLGGGRASAAGAAFVNGSAGHGVELDDGYTPGSVHPGAVVVPVALAAAERGGHDLATLLRAIAVGVEVTCRIAAAGHPVTWGRGFHNTPLAGTFGAAAAVAVLEGLDAEQVANALGIAGSHSGGLFAFIDSGGEVKRLHAGKAARDGLIAADLAAAGLTGPADVLEAPRGYFGAFTGEPARAGAVVEGLGERWTMLDTYVKPYPCCRHLHGPIDAALVLRERLAGAGTALADIERIEVATYGVASHHGHHATAELLEAQMSIPYAVAVTLVDGEVGLGQYERTRRMADDVTSLGAKVEVARSEAIDQRYPAGRPARLRVVLAGGAELVEEVAQPLGEPSNPIDDGALADKVARCAGPIIGAQRASALAQQCLAGDDLGAVVATAAGPVDRQAFDRM